MRERDVFALTDCECVREFSRFHSFTLLSLCSGQARLAARADGNEDCRAQLDRLENALAFVRG